MMLKSKDRELKSYIKPDAKLDNFSGEVPRCLELNLSTEIQANQKFFNHPQWSQTYFEGCHRDTNFIARWNAAAGSWNNKVVVDIGCGPGNLFASLGGKPELLIGVDVAEGALSMAQTLGYRPIAADAHNLPFISSFADIVALNATLHHCENMEVVLAEAARLVRPGGLLVTDHDPQLQSWNYKGIALFLYRIRLFLYKFIFRDLHIQEEERLSALATEIHHAPGKGVTVDLFNRVLIPMGFEVNLYPHNQMVGAEALQGKRGKFPHWRYVVAQILSGVNPWAPESALSLMCVARRPSSDLKS